jgi:uncharacterized protein with HEPN domain
MRSPLLYLSEMLDAARAIKDFVQGMEKETFLKDEKTRSAVAHQLLILGEASKAIPADIKSRAPNLDWRGMAGMRDRLIHAYFNVDYDLVWDTAKNRVPMVEKGLEKLIEELSFSN